MTDGKKIHGENYEIISRKFEKEKKERAGRQDTKKKKDYRHHKKK